jgi:DNA-binding NtrC family response regulator
VETELFGYRKGAFSGANEDRPGLVRSAAGGTLFLDELGDLPLAAQSAFLRLLQEREVTPVGDHRAVPVDVRVVTATHRHLASAAERGTFRADLLARLAGFTVHLPALRERREDLGLLTAAFLGRFASDPAVAVSFTLAAARALFAHAWPLNVRELEKCIERALVIAGGKPLDLEHFPELTGAPGECVRSSAAAAVADSSALPLRPLTADEQKHREALLVLLRQHSGNISAVARATGKARNQIQRWIRRYGISREG